MATIAHTDFSTSFRTSQSAHQQSNTFSYADSPLTQLPTIDFQFDDLRRRMSEFTTKFDAYIERGRKQVLAERNEFRARLSELNGRPLLTLFPPYRSQSFPQDHATMSAEIITNNPNRRTKINHHPNHNPTVQPLPTHHPPHARSHREIRNPHPNQYLRVPRLRTTRSTRKTPIRNKHDKISDRTQEGRAGRLRSSIRVAGLSEWARIAVLGDVSGV